MAKCPHLAK